MENNREQDKLDIKVNVKVPHMVFGGETYSISVEVINTTPSPINYVYVEAIELPGRLRYQKKEGGDDAISALKNYDRQVREEMRTQAEYALIFHHNMGVLKILSPFYKGLFDILKIYSSTLRGVRLTMLPSWSRRAIDIRSVKDAEEIEGSIINLLPDENKVKLAWKLNMVKLKQYEKELRQLQKRKGNEHNKNKELPVGSAVTINFKIKAPLMLSPRESEAIFQVYYDANEFHAQKTTSVGAKISLAASPISIIVGSIIGAIFGFVVRITYLTPSTIWFTGVFWQDLAGSIILGLLFAILVGKTPETRKPLTAEDFLGGILVGALAGLFSINVISALSNLMSP
jgi:hypothetical protein